MCIFFFFSSSFFIENIAVGPVMLLIGACGRSTTCWLGGSLLPGWPAGLLVCCLAGWPADCCLAGLARCLAGLACCLAGLPPASLASLPGWLACRFTGLAGWPASACLAGLLPGWSWAGPLDSSGWSWSDPGLVLL